MAHWEEEPCPKTIIWLTCKIPAKSNKPSIEKQANQDPQKEVLKAHNRLGLRYHSTLKTATRLPNNSHPSLKRKNIWKVNPTKWNTKNSGLQTLNNILIYLANNRSSDLFTTKKRANLSKRWCFINSQCPTLKLQKSLSLMRIKIKMAQKLHQRVSRVKNNSSSYY